MNKYVITIGNFDGVHSGHQEYIADALRKARERDSKLLVITFSPHPISYFTSRERFLITSMEQKKDLLESLGVSFVEVITFDGTVASLSGENFLKPLLEKYNVCSIYCGHDFSLGKDKTFQKRELVEFSKNNNVEIIESPICYLKGLRVSSTIIRDLIKKGKIIEANEMLNRKFSYRLRVQKGANLGKTIGVPTANLIPDKDLILPLHGVYLTSVLIQGRMYKSLTNVGVRPTVSDLNIEIIETHIIDFDQELYDKEIVLEFIRFIRKEKKFKDITLLKQQIENDLREVVDEN